MNKFWLLLKINLKSIINPSRILSSEYSKSKKKAASTSLLLLLLAVVMLISVGSYIVIFATELNKAGMLEMILPMGLLATASVILFTTIYLTQSYLFNIKDMDFLLSIPVSRYSVMLSRISTMYIENLLFSLLIFIPLGGVYMYYKGFSIAFVLIMLVEWIFTPAIPLIISIIIGYLIGLISNRFRNKNIVSIILSMVFFCAIMYFSTNMPAIINNFMSMLKINQGNIFFNIYYPSKFFMDSLINSNVIELLKYILISVIPFALFTYIMSISYFRIISKFSESNTKSDYKIKELKSSGQITALYKKEFKRYFSSTIYVLNTSFGMLMLLVMAIILLVGGQEQLVKLLQMPEIADMMPMGTIAIMFLVVSMSSTSCSSISTEGNNLWIIKSSPVDTKNIFIAKALLNLTVILPALYLSIILFSIKIKYTIAQLIIAFVVPTLLALVVSVFGIIVNLKLPRLDASDVVIVKQSASSFICMIGAMLVVIGICVLYVLLLSKYISFELYSLIVGLVLFLALITCIIIINTKGREYFSKLQ